MNLIALPLEESNNKENKSGEVTFIPNHGPFRQSQRLLEEHRNERKKNLRREMYCCL